MRKRNLTLCLLGALAVAAACQRAEAPKGPSSPGPSPAACNDLSIDPAISVAPGTVTEAAAAQPKAPQAGLLGGPIPPGLYDLARIEPRGGASLLPERLWEAVRVRDSDEGQLIDFATVRGAARNPPQRSTARIEEGPPARLIHTCGGAGAIELSWAAPSGELHLLLPADRGAGQILYVFRRRAG